MSPPYDGFRGHVLGFLPVEGIDVGIDRRSPVSWPLYHCHGPFPFTGSQRSARYVPGVPSPQAARLQIEELRQQALKHE